MPTVTIPTKHNINRNSGTILLRVSKMTDNLNKEILLSIGDFSLAYTEGFLILSNGTSDLTAPAALFPDRIVCLWTWVGDTHRLFVTTDDGDILIDNTSADNALPGKFGDTLRLSNTPAFTGTYESLTTYAHDFLYQPGSLYERDKALKNADVLFQATFNEAKHYTKAPVVETTFAPKDGSPILVSDAEGPLRRHYFFDETTGEYTDTHKETFYYRGEDQLALSYEGLNPAFTSVLRFESGETFLVAHAKNTPLALESPVTREAIETYLDNQKGTTGTSAEGLDGYALIHDDLLHLNFDTNEKEYYSGQSCSLSYQLSRSYNVEYNTDVAHDSLRIQLADHQDRPLEVIQEGNRFSNTRLGREIELNPLVNPRHTGFLYIDKAVQETQSFRLNVSNDYLLADGSDTADFIVEAIDAEGNEVLSPALDVFIMNEKGERTTQLGTLEPVVHFDTLKARNMAGRSYYRYRAPQIKETDYAYTTRVFLVALDRTNQRGMQVPLYLRPVTQLPATHRQTPRLPEGIARVFESVARWYERELPAGHPLHAIDQNGNGVIDREDFTYFKAKHTEAAWINELYTALKEREG